MLYYRVKKEFDNYPKYKKNKNGKIVCDGILIGNELYTLKEFQKLYTNNSSYDYFEPLEISKKRVHFFFGARFENPYKLVYKNNPYREKGYFDRVYI